uniref:Putative secreted protein n=1 Tax=Anopheles darlingi TaxID=43151 RepID=A0A2M4DBD3_ANODA
MAPQKLSRAATLTTAVVVPLQATMEPMQMDSTNCARNTMLLTMATSVPSPRILSAGFFTMPVLSTSNTPTE